MFLYLIRHGIPNYETDSLTPEGKLQAEALIDRLSEAGIDEIYSSPLGRAIQTAEPTAKALGLEIRALDWMSENIAAHNFCGVDEKGDRVTWAFWQSEKLLGKNSCYEDRDSFSHKYYRDDETARKGAAALEKASDAFLETLGFRRTGEGNGYLTLKKNDKKIALFAHQGFGLHWLSHLMNIPYHIFTASFDISHTGVTLIYFDENKVITYPQILMLSDLSHIAKSDLPMKYHDYMDI